MFSIPIAVYFFIGAACLTGIFISFVEWIDLTGERPKKKKRK